MCNKNVRTDSAMAKEAWRDIMMTKPYPPPDTRQDSMSAMAPCSHPNNRIKTYLSAITGAPITGRRSLPGGGGQLIQKKRKKKSMDSWWIRISPQPINWAVLHSGCLY